MVIKKCVVNKESFVAQGNLFTTFVVRIYGTIMAVKVYLEPAL